MGIIKSNNKIRNININTYGRFNTKEKLHKYCWQCGETLSPPSLNPFCCWDHQQEYQREVRKEADACFNEWWGRN